MGRALQPLASESVAEGIAGAIPKVIQVKVKPNAHASVFAQCDDGSWLAQIKSPPVDGKANQELIALVASHFKCRKSAVSIKSGASGRLKWVHVDT